MTWIKICGITNLEDALVAVEAGADALGFVFYEKSPRNIDPETARKIVDKLPPNIEKVGLFVNEKEQFICKIADEIHLSAVQMHGNDEDPHVADLVVAQRPLKILAAISMKDPEPEGRAMMWEQENVYAFLVDSGSPTQLGGTGNAFDWKASARSLNTIRGLGRLVLAGGLTSLNVANAQAITKAWGVDVSSGVESRPGKKDHDKVRAFIRAVREAEKASSN